MFIESIKLSVNAVIFSRIKDQVEKIISLVNESGHKNHCIGLTRFGNPSHPAPMAVNRFFGGIKKILVNGHSKV